MMETTTTRSSTSDDKTSSVRSVDDYADAPPPQQQQEQQQQHLEEVNQPKLYATLTVIEHELGESIWDMYEKVDRIGEGASTEDVWIVRKKKKGGSSSPRSSSSSSTSSSSRTGGSSRLYVAKTIDKNFIFGVFLKELRNEIEVLRTIDHPNVVRIYETFETRDLLYLIMEHCSGGDLWSRLPYREPDAARILTQILSAVAHCHRHKIVHRDLKLENVLFQTPAKDSEITLIDFGTSQKYRTSREDYTMKLHVGTTYTLSPQVLEGEYTEKTDLWSVGVIAYTMLSGKRPFDGEKDEDIRPKIQEGSYSMKGPKWDNISEEAKSFISNLLEHDEIERMSAEEALQHPWLKGYTPSSKQGEQREHILSSVEDALLQSVEEPKLKRLAMMIIAHCTPREKLRNLRDAFDALDASNDGTITFQEFQAAVRDYDFSDQQLREIFTELDQSGTGVIHYTDFLAVTLETRGQLDEALVADAFDHLDVDNCGAISKDDLETALDPVPEKDELAKELLEELNAGNEERISYGEFSSMFNGDRD